MYEKDRLSLEQEITRLRKNKVEAVACLKRFRLLFNTYRNREHFSDATVFSPGVALNLAMLKVAHMPYGLSESQFNKNLGQELQKRKRKSLLAYILTVYRKDLCLLESL